MDIPNFELLDWLLEGKKHMKYNLASSEIKGVALDELNDFSGLEIPRDFDLGKNDHFGHGELKNVLSSIYGCTPENIVTSTGGSEANFLVYLSHVKSGDHVIVESPGYEPMWRVPEMLGCEKRTWNRTFQSGFKLNLESLEKLMDEKTSLVVITNLHNPSGVYASPEDIAKAADMAGYFGAKLLIDEIFLEGCLSQATSSADMKNVIITSSMTKVFGLGGLRTGWIIASEEVSRKCQKAKAMVSGTSPFISEYVNATALLKARDWLIQRFKGIAKRNMGIISKWVEECKHLEWVEPAGGIFCFPRLLKPLDSLTLCKKALIDGGVLISPGSMFGLEGHFRLTCVFDDPPVLEKGLEALGNVLDSFTPDI